MKITKGLVEKYEKHLFEEEKSKATIEKYVRDMICFMNWLAGKSVDKTAVMEYKQMLVENYAPTSANSKISALNGFFEFNKRNDYRIKSVKIQKQIFAKQEKELTVAEYRKLLSTARKRKHDRLYYILQTVCSTGIRIGELRYVDVRAVENGVAVINCKGKMRTAFLPAALCKLLKEYVAKYGIKKGSVFVTRTGKPVDRSNIWAQMKELCKDAGIEREKVFPHNLRHLFARTYYGAQKDIVRLADILGHSSVNTTRIYTMESGSIHKKQIENLGLILQDNADRNG